MCWCCHWWKFLPGRLCCIEFVYVGLSQLEQSHRHTATWNQKFCYRLFQGVKSKRESTVSNRYRNDSICTQSRWINNLQQENKFLDKNCNVLQFGLLVNWKVSLYTIWLNIFAVGHSTINILRNFNLKYLYRILQKLYSSWTVIYFCFGLFFFFNRCCTHNCGSFVLFPIIVCMLSLVYVYL